MASATLVAAALAGSAAGEPATSGLRSGQGHHVISDPPPIGPIRRRIRELIATNNALVAKNRFLQTQLTSVLDVNRELCNKNVELQDANRSVQAQLHEAQATILALTHPDEQVVSVGDDMPEPRWIFCGWDARTD
jgi:hypothetical protein